MRHGGRPDGGDVQAPRQQLGAGRHGVVLPPDDEWHDGALRLHPQAATQPPRQRPDVPPPPGLLRTQR